MAITITVAGHPTEPDQVFTLEAADISAAAAGFLKVCPNPTKPPEPGPELTTYQWLAEHIRRTINSLIVAGQREIDREALTDPKAEWIT